MSIKPQQYKNKPSFVAALPFHTCFCDVFRGKGHNSTLIQEPDSNQIISSVKNENKLFNKKSL